MADDPRLHLPPLPLRTSTIALHLFSHVCDRLRSLQPQGQLHVESEEEHVQVLVEAAVASTCALFKQALFSFRIFTERLHRRRVKDDVPEVGTSHTSCTVFHSSPLEPLTSLETARAYVQSAAALISSDISLDADRNDSDLHFRVWFEAWEVCARKAFNERLAAQISEILYRLRPNLSYLWLFAIKNLVNVTGLVHTILRRQASTSLDDVDMKEDADKDLSHSDTERIENSEFNYDTLMATDSTGQRVFGGSFDSELEKLEVKLFPQLDSFWLTMGLTDPQVDSPCCTLDTGHFCELGNSIMIERAQSVKCGLCAIMPEICGKGGLKAPRWRARAMAVRLIASLGEFNTKASIEKLYNAPEREPGLTHAEVAMYEELLHHVAWGSALLDSQWQVREEAVRSSVKLLRALQPYIKQESLMHSIGGILAATEDYQPEVRDAAVEATMLIIKSYFLECDMAILGLIEEFVATACLNAKDDNMHNKRTEPSDDLIGLPEARTSIAAITGAVRLQLLPFVPQKNERKVFNYNVCRVPLIVAAASALLEKSNRTSNHELSVSLKALLRALSSSGYSQPLLAMLNSQGPGCTGSSIAQYYRKTSTLRDETLNQLEKVPKAALLLGLALALEGLGSDKSFHDSFLGTSPGMSELALKEYEALSFIVEALQIPPHLINRYRQTVTDPDKEEFALCAYPLLLMAKRVISFPLWLNLENQERSKLVERLILCCAALASADKADEATWTTQKLRELAISVACLLSKALQSTHKTELLDASDGDIQDLVLPQIRAILLQLAQIFKSSLGSEDNLYTSHHGESLGIAVVSVHQMRWVIEQVKHPFLGPHIDVVLPCVLTALDNPSPLIKRPAMKIFMYLAKALNPSELRWYKDVILDAVSHILIGSDELWEVAIQMAIPLVISIEGGNPRGLWYQRVFDNMLGELERHSDDQQRRTCWLQSVVPLLESMGLVLVVHFKRLLPLLYYWLHLSDDCTHKMALLVMQVIIKQTWPRITFHTSRILEAVIYAYKSSRNSKHCSQIHALVVDICKLLQRCGMTQFQSAWEKYENHLEIKPLVLALKPLKSKIKDEVDE